MAVTTSTMQWVTKFQPPPEEDLVEMYDLKVGGYILLPVSSLSVLVSGLLVLIVWINWEKISDSEGYNSCLLCLLLTLSDLTLSLFLGLPIGIRFLFQEQMYGNKSIAFYTEVLGYPMFEYLYIFRVMVIAALSVEKSILVANPLTYQFIVTKKKIWITCGILGILPLLKIIVVIYVLCNEQAQDDMGPIECDIVRSADHHTIRIPILCELDFKEGFHGFGITDTVLTALITGLCWLVMISSNVLIATKIITMLPKQQPEAVKRGLKACIVLFFVTLSFAITNFPYTVLWIVDLVEDLKQSEAKKEWNKLSFYLMIFTFVSVISHPWLYIMRLRTITKLITGYEAKVRSLFGSSPTHVPLVSEGDCREEEL